MSNCANTYEVGNTLRSTGTFRNAVDNYSPIDPTNVSCAVTAPDGTVIVYTYGTGQMIRDDIGVYYIEHLCDQAGPWEFLWYTSGNVVCSTSASIRVIA